MDGGLKLIEVAPWSAGFDEATATWEEIPFDDVVEDNMQHPTHEETTVNVGDGSARQTGKRSTVALPIRNLAAEYLNTLVQGQRYVVRLTYMGTAPNVLTFGASTGAVLRKLDPTGANFGGVGVAMLMFQTTAGATQQTTVAGPTA